VRGFSPFLLLLLLPLLSHAGWVEDRDGRTVLHVKLFDLPDPASSDAASRAGVAAVDAFKQDFPRLFAAKYRDRYQADPAKYGRHNWDQVSIELERFTGINVKGVEVDLLAIAGGLAPDVLYVNFRKSETYIQNRFLYPLDRPEDGYLSAMDQEAQDFRINAKLWPVIRRPGPGGTHVWALPYGGAMGNVLMFRKDLFDAKRLPYPTVNWNMDDIMEAAKKLTDPEAGTYGFFLVRGKHEAHYWLPMLWSFGGEAVVLDEATGQWKCAFDSVEAAEALDFYLRLSAEKWVDAKGVIRRGYSCKDSGDFTARQERGQIGMWFAYIDEKLMATINPDVTGMVPIPAGPTGVRGTELNSMMMGLFSGIKEPSVRDAAWEYMRFFDGREAMGIKTRVLVESGLGRFIHPKYLKLFGYPEIERLSPPGWAKTFDIAMETGKPEPYGGNSNLAYEMMTLPLQYAETLALRDKLPPEHSRRIEVLNGILRKGVIRANDLMMGIVTPRERLIRRSVAAVMMVLMVGVFAYGFSSVVRVFSTGKTLVIPHSGARAFSRRRNGFWMALLLFPALLTLILWHYVPLGWGSLMAFQDYRLVGDSVWVGLDNFGDVLFDGFWWQALFNSFRYSFLVLLLTFIPPILLAIFLQEIPRLKIVFRLIYYLPAVVAGIVAMLLWKEFFDPSEHGALNAVVLQMPAIGFLVVGVALLGVSLLFARRLWLNDMRWAAGMFIGVGLLLCATVSRLALPILFPGGEPVGVALGHLSTRLFQHTAEAYHWLADPDTAMLSCVIPMIWAGMGPGCLIYLAALKGIPDDLYEAADVDGATFVDKILFVVFPMLKPLILINFVGAFIASFYSATGNILVMTGGAANTEVAGLHIWYKAFTFLQFGPATAAAWMLGVILIGFTVQQLKLLARVEFRTTGKD
jgi:ABC-type sugar transport system permease subunit/ABC-type glycerol-3-phosphate transport system substrate-binding protein